MFTLDPNKLRSIMTLGQPQAPQIQVPYAPPQMQRQFIPGDAGNYSGIPQGVQPGGVGLQPGQYAPGASGPHPGVETGYMPKGTMNAPPTYNPATGKYDINIGMGGRIPPAGGSKVDMGKIEQLLNDISGMSFPGSYGAEGGGSGGGGGGGGAGGGAGMGQLDPMSPIVPGIASLAPNQGFRRVLPRRPEDDISGGK